MRNNNNNNKKNSMKHRHNNRRFHGNRGNNDGQNLARQKHYATQMREKFANLARDVQLNGDRADVEYYLQHVDHYVRVLAQIAEREADRDAERNARRDRETDQADQAADAQPNEQAGAGADSSQDDASEEAVQTGGNDDAPAASRGRSRRPASRKKVADQTDQTANNAAGEIPLPASMLPEIPAGNS